MDEKYEEFYLGVVDKLVKALSGWLLSTGFLDDDYPDLLQEAMVKIWTICTKSGFDLDNPRSSGYLYVAGKNAMLDYGRKLVKWNKIRSWDCERLSLVDESRVYISGMYSNHEESDVDRI